MCGLAAVFSYRADGCPIDRAELARMREAMRARGPDGAGLWISPDRRVGLAHRRLSIIDLSQAGSQPMATADGSLHVVFNGEIYNYMELRRDLCCKGYQFISNSDTEVLLYLYVDRGPAMVDVLRGMYAFVIWDSREKALFLARDPFGIKPLYYADDGETLRVASQVKALMRGGRIDSSPEPAGYVGFFLWGHVPEPHTVYKAVKALPAGASLSIKLGGRVTVGKFSDIAEEMVSIEGCGSPLRREEVQERLRAALLDSVRHHMVSDVPVGLFLSSGLDSATLAALATEIAPRRFRTITLGFREYLSTADDETPLAELVARQYGTVHETRWVYAGEFADELGNLLEAMDQPSVDGINTYFVSKAAAAAGLKVAWSGLGGDELFGGYPSFVQIPAMVRAFGFPGARLMGIPVRLVTAPLLRRFTSPKYAGLLEYGGSYGGAYLLRRGLFMPWELPEVMDASMARDGWQTLLPLSRLEEIAGRLKRSWLKVSALEATWYMRNQLLRDADWAGMAHSVEIRVPLVDIELLRGLRPLWANGSPPGKSDMARTPAKELPACLFHRRKTGFTVPLSRWMACGCNGSGGRGLRGWARTVVRHWGGVG